MTVKELLSERSRWTQGVFARDGEGEACDEHGGRAVCWCFAGALNRVYPGSGENWDVRLKVLRAIDELYPEHGIVDVNDNLGYEAVMKVVEAAGV